MAPPKRNQRRTPPRPPPLIRSVEGRVMLILLGAWIAFLVWEIIR